MVAYNFKSQFADDVAEGRKCQTIRANGKRRHARPGETLQLYTGQRTKACRKLVDPDPVCTHSGRIVLEIGKASLVINQRHCFVLHARVDGKQVNVDALAQADGFECAEDMYDFFEETHGLPFRGTLIRW